jgi:hypothetical protein
VGYGRVCQHTRTNRKCDSNGKLPKGVQSDSLRKFTCARQLLKEVTKLKAPRFAMLVEPSLKRHIRKLAFCDIYVGVDLANGTGSAMHSLGLLLRTRKSCSRRRRFGCQNHRLRSCSEASNWVCITFLGRDSTKVEFARRWRDFNRPHRVTQNLDAHPRAIPSNSMANITPVSLN